MPLGFGCAPVMGRISRRKALRAMALANDLGVMHFDVARSYGFGDAEGVVGEFLASSPRRADVTVTSKFGVVPPNLRAWQKVARPIVRVARDRVGFFKQSVLRGSRQLLSNRRYDLAYAKTCLATSLGQLGRERIDFYLLHEPLGMGVVPDDLVHWLEDCVREGKVGQWGVAHHSVYAPIMGKTGSIVQVASASSVESVQRGDGGLRFVTSPFFGGAIEERGPVATVSRLLCCPLQTAALAWAYAQADFNGFVVCGMFEDSHIRANVLAMQWCVKNKEAIEAVMSSIAQGAQ